MPNGYTVVPAIIPGPLTVGGPLTVTNGQLQTGAAGTPLALLNDELRVGAIAPFWHMAKPDNNNGILTFNIDKLNVTRDSAAFPSFAMNWFTGLGKIGHEHDYRNAAADLAIRLFAEWASLQGSVLTQTGSIAELDGHLVNVPASTFGPHGAVCAESILVGNLQGAVASTFRFRFGGVLLDSFTKTAVANILWRIWLFNRGVSNAQDWFAIRFDSVAGVSVARGTAAVDTTLLQVFKETVQPGATTDSWDLRGWRVAPAGFFDVAF